jgi:ubiquinone/menaquinone biosynthesis C-methylase UbiE
VKRPGGLVFLLAIGACAARAAEHQVPHEPHAHGTHAATARHSFDDVEHWQAVFDDPSRDAWQRPREVVRALDLPRGAWVADLGAGTGYFSRYLSEAVGPDGTVFAVDTEPNLVSHLRARAEKEGTANVVPVLASRDNPRLPVGAVDLLLVVDTFHHIDDRPTYFRAVRRFLRQDGRVAVIDWHKRALPVGPPLDHKLAREQVVEEMDEAGYELSAEPKGLLPYQYVLIFKPR